MTWADSESRALSLRQAQLTPVTSHPLGIALLTACPPAFVPFAYAAAEAAVSQGRPPGEVLSNLLEYLAQHPMPTEDVAWAVLAATL
ncbi:hypothetical protein [Deinococcus sp. QL22]|uniref:hypothetical protein n=1 Tax=Deinococcus sp. QL22 TaxID=2939437 RepID=UPI00201824BD|nr:hypothetical protein [Deinococcus sp. QL22]UQN10840.1 hypothetical protein M1R55_31605 [Deinococcus sp. QL22]